MNISPINNRNTSFGMAFTKPNEEVLNHFKNTLKNLPQGQRDVVSGQIIGLVKEANSCPVKIEHSVAKGLKGSYYVPIVNNEPMITYADNEVENILESMKNAVLKAKDIANLKENMGKIKKAFDINA